MKKNYHGVRYVIETLVYDVVDVIMIYIARDVSSKYKHVFDNKILINDLQLVKVITFDANKTHCNLVVILMLTIAFFIHVVETSRTIVYEVVCLSTVSICPNIGLFL